MVIDMILTEKKALISESQINEFLQFSVNLALHLNKTF